MPVRMSQPSGQRLYVSANDFNVDPTGTVESTSGFAKAFTKLASISNGAQGAKPTLFIPAGYYITDGFDLPGQFNLTRDFAILGSDQYTTWWQLKNGANKSLLSAYTSTINPNAGFGTNPTALSFFSIRNITFLGNYLNQSGTSYVMQFYAVGYILQDITVYNGFSGGIQSDYHNAVPTQGPLECRWHNVRVEFNNDIGVKYYGPSDSQFTNCIFDNSGSHNLQVTPNSTGYQFNNCHFWFPGQGNNSVNGLIEGSGTFIASEFEGSDTAQVVMNAQGCVFMGGQVFGGGHNGTAFQIGQVGGLTPFNESVYQSGGLTQFTNPNGYLIDTLYANINNMNGVINFAHDGMGTVRGFIQNFGNFNPAINGTPGAQTSIDLQVWDGTGQYNIKKYPLLTLGGASTFLSGSGAPSNSLGNNGDYYFRQDTPGTANQRLYVKAAGAWVGIL